MTEFAQSWIWKNLLWFIACLADFGNSEKSICAISQFVSQKSIISSRVAQSALFLSKLRLGPYLTLWFSPADNTHHHVCCLVDSMPVALICWICQFSNRRCQILEIFLFLLSLFFSSDGYKLYTTSYFGPRGFINSYFQIFLVLLGSTKYFCHCGNVEMWQCSNVAM